MTSTWAVLQLREGLSLSMPVTELEAEFLRRWPRSIFRFPAVRQGCIDPENPLSAYVFVEPPIDGSFERSSLISGFLKDPVTHRPYYVTEIELAQMTPLPAFPPPGTSVLVTAGDYTGLEGTIVEINCNTCKVLIELWSRKSVLTLASNEFQSV